MESHRIYTTLPLTRSYNLSHSFEAQASKQSTLKTESRAQTGTPVVDCVDSGTPDLISIDKENTHSQISLSANPEPSISDSTSK